MSTGHCGYCRMPLHRCWCGNVPKEHATTIKTLVPENGRLEIGFRPDPVEVENPGIEKDAAGEDGQE